MGFAYSRMSAWLSLLKEEISQQKWEANEKKLKLMLFQLSFSLGFLRGIEELTYVEATLFLFFTLVAVVERKRSTVIHFIISLSLQ